MDYKWYVVHVYSGSEKRVKETIEEQMKSKNMEEFIEDILVPTEEVLEIRKGAKVKTEKKPPAIKKVKQVCAHAMSVIWRHAFSVPKKISIYFPTTAHMYNIYARR